MTQRSVEAAWPADPAQNVAVAPGTYWQRFPHIAPDGYGGAYVGWEDEGAVVGGVSSVYVQHITASGDVDGVWPIGGLIPDATSSGGDQPEVAADGRHGAIVVWRNADISGHMAFRVQRLDSLGGRRWGSSGQVLANSPAGPEGGGLDSPMIVPDSAQGAIIAWNDQRYSYAWNNVFARRVNRDGVVLWNQDGVRVCPGAWGQSGVRAVSDSAGGVLLAWGDGRDGFPLNVKPAIYAQRIDGTGTPLWPIAGVAVCPSTIGYPSISGMCVDAKGGAFVAWTDYRTRPHGDAYLQHLLGSGVVDPAWQVGGMVIDSTSDYPGPVVAIPDGSGGVLLLWGGTRTTVDG